MVEKNIRHSTEEEEEIEEVLFYRRKRVIIPFALLVAAALIVSWRFYASWRRFVSTDDAYVDTHWITISPKILGRVDSVTVDEGDKISRGQVLVKLDETDLRAQEESAKAALTYAEESVDLAKVNLDKARRDLDRAEPLFKGGGISKERYDHLRHALESAQAEAAIAQARVGTAQAQLSIADTQLGNTVIASPLDGVVSKKWVLPGNVVQPGQPVLSVYDPKDVWVTANLEETKLRHLRVDDPVAISVDTYPGVAFTGKVFQIGSYTAAQFSLIPPNNASGNFTKVTQRVPVKISIVDPPGSERDHTLLLPGMSVEVKVRIR